MYHLRIKHIKSERCQDLPFYSLMEGFRYGYSRMVIMNYLKSLSPPTGLISPYSYVYGYYSMILYDKQDPVIAFLPYFKDLISMNPDIKTLWIYTAPNVSDIHPENAETE